jgi:hypothetical protein
VIEGVLTVKSIAGGRFARCVTASEANAILRGWRQS